MPDGGGSSSRRGRPLRHGGLRSAFEAVDDKALRRGNALLALLHAAKAAVILALSTDFALPVTGAFLEAQPGSGLPKQDCSSTSESARSSARSCCSRRSITLSSHSRRSARYERYLVAGVNPFRWLEYSCLRR